MNKAELKKELIKIRNGGFITPLLEELTKGGNMDNPHKTWSDGQMRAKIDEFIEKIPVENQAEPSMWLSDFYDFLITGKMPPELNKETKKQIDRGLDKLIKEYKPALKKLGKEQK